MDDAGLRDVLSRAGLRPLAACAVCTPFPPHSRCVHFTLSITIVRTLYKVLSLIPSFLSLIPGVHTTCDTVWYMIFQSIKDLSTVNKDNKVVYASYLVTRLSKKWFRMIHVARMIHVSTLSLPMVFTTSEGPFLADSGCPHAVWYGQGWPILSCLWLVWN